MRLIFHLEKIHLRKLNYSPSKNKKIKYNIFSKKTNNPTGILHMQIFV